MYDITEQKHLEEQLRDRRSKAAGADRADPAVVYVQPLSDSSEEPFVSGCGELSGVHPGTVVRRALVARPPSRGR